ncbi:hypothetical protein [Serratia silvae]|uniref:Fimbrial protein n=1 Tax=Serratia silvae TaxID=2824122 RepID=A0ABT0K7I6_9GAMM|nr:hypothetical protein [Serratia silvae]MCL1027980.1 hypothetical protein [Serratia silvae]
MKRKTITLIRGLSLITLLWFVTPYSMAQNCQVVVSHPEIQLGKQRHTANAATLFTRQEVTVVAECVGEGPITLLIDGTPDEGGQHFHFGAMGRMTLSLLAAQYDGGDTGLRLSSASQGEKQLSPGSSVLLPPGSQLTTLAPAVAGKETHLLTLQLRLDFPASGDEGRIRDLTELGGQVRFEARQY